MKHSKPMALVYLVVILIWAFCFSYVISGMLDRRMHRINAAKLTDPCEHIRVVVEQCARQTVDEYFQEKQNEAKR